jgi:Ni,Fe-hydrogenase III small subunit
MKSDRKKKVVSLHGQVFRRLKTWLFWQPAAHTQAPLGKAAPFAVFIRQVDGGSCNAAELEAAALFNPLYDAERFGFHLVSSPRHADLLLISGPLVHNMELALLEAFYAMPEPRRVVTLGDGFRPDCVFQGSYAVARLPAEVEACWVAHILGDPPSPERILSVLLELPLSR